MSDTVAQAGIITVPWLDGLKPFSGYDNSSAQAMAKGDAFDLPSNGAGFDLDGGSMALTGTTDVQWFQSVEELASVLRVKGGVSAAYSIFSGGLAGDFLRNVSINTYSIYLVIHAVYNAQFERCDKVQPPLTTQASTATAQVFRQKYGDYFVIGKQKGGERIIVLELTANTAETKSKLITATQFDVKSPVVSVKSNLSSGISSALSIAGVSLRLHLAEEGVGPGTLGLAGATGSGLKKIATKPATKPTPKAESTGTDATKTTAKVEDKKPPAKEDEKKPAAKEDEKKPAAKAGDAKPGDAKATGKEDPAKAGEAPVELPNKEAPNVTTDDDLVGSAEVNSYEVDANSPLIDSLLKAADSMKAEVTTYGVNRFALVKPFTLLQNSPLDSVLFTPNGKDDLYDRMEKVFNRAKFIRDSADYAIDASVAGADISTYSASEDDLANLRKEMQGVMGTVVAMDASLRSGAKTVADAWSSLPDIPNMSRLPARFRAVALLTVDTPIVATPVDIMASLMDNANALQVIDPHDARAVLNGFQSHCVRAETAISETVKALVALLDGTATVDEAASYIADLASGGQHSTNQLCDDLRGKLTRALQRADKTETAALAKARVLVDQITGDASGASEYGTNARVGTAMTDIWVALVAASTSITMATRAIPPNKALGDVLSFKRNEWEKIASTFGTAAKQWSGGT